MSDRQVETANGPVAGSAERHGPTGLPFAGLTRNGAALVALVGGAALVTAIAGTAATQNQPVAGIASPGPLIQLGIPVTRVLLDVAAVTAAGFPLLAKLLGFDDPEATEPVVSRTRRFAVWASGVWTVAALASVVLLAAELNPGAFPTPSTVWAYVTNVAAGKGLLMSACCGALSFWLSRVSLRHGEKVPAELRIGIALFGLLPLPLTGHASNCKYHDLSMISMELHVVAASAWTGGLAAVVIFLARQPALLRVALPRFSKLATWCVVIVGLSGVFNGLLELALSPITTLPGSLFGTRYGVILLAKAGCMAVIAGLAAVTRFRLLERVADGQAAGIALWCGCEVLILSVAFGVAAVLTRAPVTPF